MADKRIVQAYFDSGHSHEVNQIRANKHRSLLASCSDDTTVRIWQVLDWRAEGVKVENRMQMSSPSTEYALTTLSGHTEAIGSISWRPTSSGVDKILAT
jgi:transducin (beta)-like 1